MTISRTKLAWAGIALSAVLIGAGCDAAVNGQAAGTAAGFGESELPGGGLRVPHNQRLHLSTDQKWIQKEGHLSDLIRLQWTAERAKPAIVWVDEQGNDKTAIISHDKANNPEQHDHKHISFETTMAPDGEYAGQLFTRLEIPYDTDVSEIRTHSSNFNVMDGILRVAGETATNRELNFSRAEAENKTTSRWSVRADNAAESGGNAGSNFRIVRFDDEGNPIDSPVFIQRSSGNVGIGTSEPTGKLDVAGDRLRVRESFTPSSSASACNPGEMAWDESYMYVCTAKDQWKRSPLSAW